MLEREVLDELVDDVFLRPGGEASSGQEEVPDVPVADLADEGGHRPGDAITLRDGDLEPVEVAVLLHQGRSGFGGQENDRKVTGFGFKECVGLVVAALVESDTDIANELSLGKPLLPSFWLVRLLNAEPYLHSTNTVVGGFSHDSWMSISLPPSVQGIRWRGNGDLPTHGSMRNRR